MKRSLAAILAAPLLCAACVTQQPWTPTVDTFGSERSQYVDRDLNQCRMLAAEVSGSAPAQGARGALVGGAVGAASGAALGAALGNAGRGAALGAAAGGIGTGVVRTQQSESAFRQAYINCMRQRGHRVLN